MSSQKKAVSTDKAPSFPQFPLSQAIVHNGMIYCSGNIGMDPTTKSVVSGSVADRTAQALRNISAILEAAGSSLKNVVKANVYITTMENFQAMNDGYRRFFDEPQPARTCVAVKELPMGTDVEIECIAHL
ncbi:endoribonuclease L-PSP [Viridothelium virens]|uniref:Endoribonuclease L-PSP n=1 Tax=Viridothelium virens TaxID=1048519 RepID=A0A6A6HAG6_VIRVR|nr:endoribonuclease L-PSP [Viridothelium virens]